MRRRTKSPPPSHSITRTDGYSDFPAEALLDRVTRALSDMGSVDALVKVVLAEGRRMLKARETYLLLREEGQLVLRGALGIEREGSEPLRLPEGWGLEGRAIEQATPVFAFEAQAEPSYQPIPGRRARAGALLAVPLRLRGRVVGVVVASRPEEGWFTEREAHWLGALAQLAAVAIENERLRATEQHQARLRAREDFLAVVSHELKTPVAVIRAYVEVLLKRAGRNGRSGSDLDVLQNIQDQADRMLAMIEELLDFQRLEVGQLRLELSQFDLCTLAERVVRELQLTTASHRLTCIARDKGLTVLADRKRIEEVLTNLLDNAVKYSSPGSEVLVELRRGPGEASEHAIDGQGECAVLVVGDQGIGIRADEHKRIFDRFYQATKTPVRGHVGLGLGLYISREIVQRHGGQIWVESAPGHGSRFYVTLPLAHVTDLD